jgi:hypothetical protein
MALIAPLAQVTRSTNRSTPTMAITECQLQNVTAARPASIPARGGKGRQSAQRQKGVITLVLAALGISAESGNTRARLQRHNASRARGHARMDSRAWKPRIGGSTMTAQPADRVPASDPDTGSYEVIHLGGQAAVVVPVSDFLRLQALEQAASAQELEDAEDKAALADWRAREAAGQTSYVPHDEALRRLGLAG